MKAVILAGGLGTRISEESDLRPKPMVEIGGKPILWHIMKMYSYHGIKDFVICLGYKGYMIKEYFYNYYRHTSDFRINLSNGDYRILSSESEDWTITFVDTGLGTQTGGRLKRVERYIDNQTFCLTYGDGVSDIDIGEEILFHRKHQKKVTIAAVQPPGRFGSITFDEHQIISSFQEKPSDGASWINGGFFVLEPDVFDFIQSDDTIWEKQPLEKLVELGEVVAFKHHGFWQPMDTLREKRELEQLAQNGTPPWLR